MLEMKPGDAKNELWDAKFDHLTEDELDRYREKKLDEVAHARADAHLRLCLICERRFRLLDAEDSAMAGLATTDDLLLKEIKRVSESSGKAQSSTGKDDRPLNDHTQDGPLTKGSDCPLAKITRFA